MFYHRIDYGTIPPIFRGAERVDVSEVAYHVAAGFEPLSVLRLDSGRWQWGVGAAVKHARFNSPTKATGTAVDIGSLVRVARPVAVRGVPEDGFVSGSFGVMLRNINAGDFGTDDATTEIARSVRLGLAFDSGFRQLERFGYLFGLLVAVDGRFYVGELAERDPTLHVGIEGRFVDLVSYRVGFERDTQVEDTDVHYGVALGVRDLRWNQRTLGVLLEFAAVDTAERSEHYAASMYFSF